MNSLKPEVLVQPMAIKVLKDTLDKDRKRAHELGAKKVDLIKRGAFYTKQLIFSLKLKAALEKNLQS